ncbi:hypothetical protein ACPCSE_29805 [Streptomyces cellulosae]
MPSAATDTKDLVPTIDFDGAVAVLQKDKNASLTDLLADLATLPVTAPPAEKKKPSKEAASQDVEEARQAIQALPEVFGTVKEPAARRQFSPAELRKVLAEKSAIADAKSRITKREAALNEMISTHFDVYAESLGLVDETVPKDAKGHYLIGSKGNRLEQAVEGTDQLLTREKATDKSELSHDLLLDAYEQGKISRAEYLAFTKTIRVIDEDKISSALLSKARRQRAQVIIAMITQIKPGKLSVHVR